MILQQQASILQEILPLYTKLMADTVVLTVVPGKKASFYHEVIGKVRFSVKVA